MVTPETNATQTYFGKSKDTKPDYAENGSRYVEMDTGNLYFYDGEAGKWLPWGS